MKLSLRNLVRGLRGRSLARCSARPSRPTRLQVEALEERAVPAVMNLTGYTFGLPGATLTIKGENVMTGVFAGTFFDATSGINIALKGHLQKIGPNLDKMDFQGIGTKGLETEKVVFNGDLHEALFPLMFGQLTESYSLPVGQWTVSKRVESYGRPPLGHLPFTASQAAPIDAFFAEGAWRHVEVHDQNGTQLAVFQG